MHCVLEGSGDVFKGSQMKGNKDSLGLLRVMKCSNKR